MYTCINMCIHVSTCVLLIMKKITTPTLYFMYLLSQILKHIDIKFHPNNTVLCMNTRLATLGRITVNQSIPIKKTNNQASTNGSEYIIKTK